MKLFCCLLILLNLFCFGLGIDCWVCTSSDDGCGEEINSVTLQSSLKTGSGCKACGKEFKSLGTLFSTVERTCLSSASDTCTNNLGYGTCSCSTTFCNGQAGRYTYSMTVLTLVCSFIILLVNMA